MMPGRHSPPWRDRISPIPTRVTAPSARPDRSRRACASACRSRPTAYTVDQVLANPIQLNSRLGTYTNFVNLLDLCGLALPASMRPDGIPFGITLLGVGGNDAALASLGRLFHADTRLPMGATGRS